MKCLNLRNLLWEANIGGMESPRKIGEPPRKVLGVLGEWRRASQLLRPVPMLISDGEWGLPHRNPPPSTVPSHIILSQLREEAVVRPFLTSPGGSLHPRLLYNCTNKSSSKTVQENKASENSLAVWILCPQGWISAWLEQLCEAHV